MSAVPIPPSLFATAPELARRLGFIVAGLAAVVARRFLREPALVGLIVPLWGWLNRTARRFERVVTRQVAVRAGRASGKTVKRARGLRLPSGRGWLVRVLGYEAVGYGSQLEHLLAEPDMQALLASVPAVGRVLRPLCRMLGLPALAAVAPSVPASSAVVVEMRARVGEARPPSPQAWPSVGPAEAPALPLIYSNIATGG